jgi:hypothetical protein
MPGDQTQGPEFKPQYYQNKQQNKTKQKNPSILHKKSEGNKFACIHFVLG